MQTVRVITAGCDAGIFKIDGSPHRCRPVGIESPRRQETGGCDCDSVCCHRSASQSENTESPDPGSRHCGAGIYLDQATTRGLNSVGIRSGHGDGHWAADVDSTVVSQQADAAGARDFNLTTLGDNRGVTLEDYQTAIQGPNSRDPGLPQS